MCLMPSRVHRVSHTADINWVPRSDVTAAGTPNLHIHPVTSASAAMVASIFLTGTASNHLVKIYLKHSGDVGSGPTRSTCRWLNPISGTGIVCLAAAGYLVTLLHWHSWQSLHHTSAVQPCHTKQQLINLRVALMPGWASPCTAAKTVRLKAAGTMGQGALLETLQITSAPAMLIRWIHRDGEETAS